MELAHQLLTAPGVTPSKWIFFLHGILGTGTNWRTFARRLVQAHHEWGAVLVDLRMHGGSQAFEPPHTVAAAAADLLDLEGIVPGPVRGVLGHSFGGKVLLAYVQQRGAQLEHAFLLDSSPGPRETGRGSETTLEVLSVLRRHPGTFETKGAFIASLREGGIDRGIAEWLAMNLVPAEGGGQRFGLDLTSIQALLDDYFRIDLWPVLESLPSNLRMDVVLGVRSHVFDDRAKERLRTIAAAHPNFALHTVHAGHWVHVEDPEGVFRVVSAAL